MIGRRLAIGGAIGTGVVGTATLAAAALRGKPTVLHLQPLRPVALKAADTMTRVSPVKAAPAFSFVDDKGVRRTLADYAGKGIVLNFWATWCAPCVAELPSLVELSKGGAADGFVVLPLSIDHGGAAVVGPWLARHGADSLPVLLDPGQQAAVTLGLRGVPTTFVIDRAGQIRGLMEGEADWSTPAARTAVRSLI